jgi:enoyl-CoA hydratase/carnithine racemase
MPFINLGLVPEFASTFSVPMCVGYLRAAELLQLGLPFDAKEALELGLVTRVVPDQRLLETATDTAQKLAEKPADALQASKRLMKKPWRDALLEAAKAENNEFSVRVRSADTKEAIAAFFEKRPPDFTRTARVAVAQEA